MARSQVYQPVLPSLLDRLLDDEPGQHLESVRSSTELLQQMRAGVRRDLENLLNTRLIRQIDPKQKPELVQSVVNYGLPDFSTVQLGSAEHRERLRDVIRQTIERFECRLRQVSVELVDTGDDQEHERTLHLKISALLMVEPDPIPLMFDSRIHALDRMVRLRERRHG
ncbi:MAG: type VI secretion system baseplate subunit TssE [Ectothiorhodospiraceae bacterium]|nr:type VI secretion system baseplate subunit TssE [Ectothiorhodospiraceae bacterium]